MEKLKAIPLVLCLLYTTKLLILQANYADAPVVIVLALLAAYYDSSVGKKDLVEINKTLQELKDSDASILRRHDELKTTIAGVKMNNQMRPSNVR